MEKRKVHVYYRVSKGYGQTYQQQIDDITAAYGVDVDLDIYGDTISGWSDKKRPDYDMIVKLVNRGSVKELAVWALDRLGRNAREAVKFLMLCLEKGVRVKVISCGFDFAGPFGLTVATMMFELAQMESDLKSQRIRAKIRHQKSKGEFVPHGRAPHCLSPKIAGKAEEVFTMLRAGKSIRYIADKLEISEHSVMKLSKLRGQCIVTPPMLSKMFPDWWKRPASEYPTFDEVQQRAREMFPGSVVK